ncbi:hypothetical protein [Methylophaga sp.]|uniref:hypothetical protein n=1 Tax=Methylophaga sp. TaxID=2024840 RepID=UPI003A8D9418
MSQLFTDAILEELEKDSPRLVMAVEILYAPAPVRAHSGVGTYVIDGQDYVGVGQLGGISAIPQTSKTSPSNVELTMSGLDPTLVAQTLNERSQGRKAKIMLCSIGDDETVTSVSVIFAGRVSTQQYTYGKKMSVSVKLVDRFADWERAGTKRFDYESHLARVPDDHIFKYLSQMASLPIYWGSKKDAPSFNYRSE